MCLKRILLTLLLIVAISVASNAKDAEDIEGYPKGPVKEVLKTIYNLEHGNNWITTLSFNSRKHLLEGKNESGSWSVKGIFRWNEENDVIEAQFYKDGLFHYKETYQYDNQPNISKRYISWMESDYGVPFYRYEHRGNRSHFSKYDAQDRLIFKEESNYDVSGNRLELKRYNSNNQIVYRLLNEYFAPGKMSQEKEYDKEGKLVRDNTYKYDSNGQKIESIRMNKTDGKVDKTTYEYDELGHIIRQAYYSNDQLSSQVLYTYHENFRRQIRTDLDAQGNPTQITETTFDERGNTVEIQYQDQNQSRYVYVFDEQNRKVKEESWKGNLLTNTFEIIYNPQGNPIKETSFHNYEGQIQQSTTLYQYDTYGNMTERLTSNLEPNTQMSVISERVTWQYDYFSPSTIRSWASF